MRPRIIQAMELREWLIMATDRAGESGYGVAKKTGKNQSTISRIITGETKSPGWYTVAPLIEKYAPLMQDTPLYGAPYAQVRESGTGTYTAQRDPLLADLDRLTPPQRDAVQLIIRDLANARPYGGKPALTGQPLRVIRRPSPDENDEKSVD